MTGRESVAMLLTGLVGAVLCLAWLTGTIFAVASLPGVSGNGIFPALVGIIALQMLIPAIYFGVRERRQVIGPGR